ncbi:hypothetical protein ZIOFF_018885 [Zingiber officinale]|uniref:Protein kinase domain-containing protein n=1 Tax=Zingiber officinale TaxID=94328 RepID=A0A8J5LMG8_ZINOF|nr:hypothetical protein ZIOFF_018885 [Zingiber officinale]
MGACFSCANQRPRNTGANAGKQQGRTDAKDQQKIENRPKGKAGEKEKSAGGRVVPCGKRTNFGYDTDFASKYTVGKLLGHGQFGYTFIATDKANGDQLAVKKIDKNKMVLPIAVEDVKREVKILKALKGHENVVHFYNAYEDDTYVYIVMELCEGGELLDRILAKKDSHYSEKDAAVVVRQMLKVAAECHLHGLVHRDMKPENFLFKSTKDDSPLKATDFGLSDFIRPGKNFHDIVGSAYYVAPEVLKRRSGPESDVWSIGVITYILLCGRRPFWDKTEDGIFKEGKGFLPLSSKEKDLLASLSKQLPASSSSAGQLPATAARMLPMVVQPSNTDGMLLLRPKEAPPSIIPPQQLLVLVVMLPVVLLPTKAAAAKVVTAILPPWRCRSNRWLLPPLVLRSSKVAAVALGAAGAARWLLPPLGAIGATRLLPH